MTLFLVNIIKVNGDQNWLVTNFPHNIFFYADLDLTECLFWVNFSVKSVAMCCNVISCCF